MVTFGCGKKKAAEERAKSVALAKKAAEERIKAENEAVGIDKLEYELARAENTLRGALYDLSTPLLRNNIAVKQKADNARTQIENLKRRIEEEKIKSDILKTEEENKKQETKNAE